MAKATGPCRHQQESGAQGVSESEAPSTVVDTTPEKEIPRVAKWVNSRLYVKKAIAYLGASKEDRDRAQQVVTQPAVPRCEICREETRQRRKYRWRLILTLLIPNFMNSLDLTVIATAVPIIASDFAQISQLSWIVNAFTLTSTAFVISYGQFSDVFGRHWVFQFSIFCVLIGSVICGFAQNYGLFLFGRALQGLGYAGIATLTKIVLADKVSLKENSTNNTIFAFLNGASYSVGPVIGGYLTAVNWRWCFWINLPMCAASHAAVFFFLRHELLGPQPQTTADEHGNIITIERHTFLEKLSVIDYGGITLFLTGACLLILGLLWGGADYKWASAAVLVPIVVGTLLICGFLYYEHLMEPGNYMAKKFPDQAAMLPWSILRKRDTIVLSYLNFSTGMALFSAFYFVSIYFTIVEGYEPSRAGLQLLYYTPGLGVGVYLAMFICNVYPRQTWLPMFFGSWIEPIGLGLLTYALSTRNVAMVNGFLALSGVGTGVRLMPGTLHAVGIEPHRIAQVVSLMSFVLPLGGTLGLTMMGSVFNNKFAQGLQKLGHDGTGFAGKETGRSTQSIEEIRQLPAPILEKVAEIAKEGVVWSYVSILPLVAAGGLLAFALGNVQITDSDPQEKGQDGDAKQGEVVSEPYLLWLLRNRRRLGDREQAEQEPEGK
ncbi:Efflux pump FUS6 [Drechslerella dactyloides]|uniref:Efflux pump FUS6 n=1 Tax=Drechslerella dactyloides TaxID=74499 RepID=A0AAD6IWL1_DREDA|nr:Efflux pump FUS6 [Drechslerella dactyloides]